MIFAIGDLHLDITKEKDMCIFGQSWENYEEKIFSKWNDFVGEEDLVLVPGDISWALKLEEAYEDLKRLDKLRGKKLLLKGNHDYWWNSLNKLKSLNLETIEFMQNTSFIYNKIRIAGTRGWKSKDSNNFDENDHKVFKRELERLELSLKDKLNEEYKETIVIMHYPPFDKNLKPNEFEEIFFKYNIKTVIYGHIHGKPAKYMPNGIINGIKYYCVSADAIDFEPVLIRG